MRINIVDSVEYMCCVLLILLNFERDLQNFALNIRHFNANIFRKLSRI